MERFWKVSGEDRGVVLLVLACPERRARLGAILQRFGVESLWVSRCWEVLALLQTRPLLISVVTEATLEDGNWCDVLRTVVDYDPLASVVMIAPPSTDEIPWSDAISQGVHDILVEPFTRSEAEQVLERALRISAGQEHRLIASSRRKQQVAAAIS